MGKISIALIGFLAFVISAASQDASFDQLEQFYSNEHFVVVVKEGAVLSSNDFPSTKIKKNTYIVYLPSSVNGEQDLRKDQGISYVSPMFHRNDKYVGVLNEVLIKIQIDGLQQFETWCKEFGIRSESTNQTLLYHCTVPVSNGSQIITIADELNDLSWVVYATPNYWFPVETHSIDPFYNRQWSIDNQGTPLQGNGTPDADMDVDSAWTVTCGDSTIKIGILDSGVDTLHPDLISNILPGFDAFAMSDTLNTKGYPTLNHSSDGHGTACAGIAAAVKDNAEGIAGIANGCRFAPVRLFYYTQIPGLPGVIPYTTSAAIARGVQWSWKTAELDVLSNSWGITNDVIPLLPGGLMPAQEAIDSATAHGRNGLGCVMLFSSGNDDFNQAIWPSRLSNTIAVGATTMCDERKSTSDCSTESWGSNHGEGLDMAAPGVRITTTDVRGLEGSATGDYFFAFNGTSAACPNTAGVAALVLSVNSDLYWQDVKHIMTSTCEKVGGYSYIDDGNGQTRSEELGYGRVNAFEAVKLAMSYTNLEHEQNHSQVVYYPNPATDRIFVNQRESKIWLTDNLGRQFALEVVTLGDERSVFSLSGIAPGVYLIHTKEKFLGKILVQ